MSVYSQLSCRGNVFFPIIGEKKRIGRAIGAANRMLEDFSIGFQRAYLIGQDKLIEIIQDTILRTDEFKVRLVRVRYQNQWVIPLEGGE